MLWCRMYQGGGWEWSTPGVGNKGEALFVADLKGMVKLTKIQPGSYYHHALVLLENIRDKIALDPGGLLPHPINARLHCASPLLFCVRSRLYESIRSLLSTEVNAASKPTLHILLSNHVLSWHQN